MLEENGSRFSAKPGHVEKEQIWCRHQLDFETSNRWRSPEAEAAFLSFNLLPLLHLEIQNTWICPCSQKCVQIALENCSSAGGVGCYDCVLNAYNKMQQQNDESKLTRKRHLPDYESDLNRKLVESLWASLHRRPSNLHDMDTACSDVDCSAIGAERRGLVNDLPLVIERGDLEGLGVEGLQHDGSSSCVGNERVVVDGNATAAFEGALWNASG